MSRSILVIVDDHEHDCLSLAKAKYFATHLDATIDIVRFLSQLDTQNEAGNKQVIEQARLDIEKDRSDIFGDDGNVNCSVIPAGDIAGWVVETLTKKPFDLVVKTGHRSENLFHIPTDWQLMRQLSCPILITSDRKWKSKQLVMAAVNLASQKAKNKELNALILQWTTLLSEAFDYSPHVVYSIPISKTLLELGVANKHERQPSKEQEAEKKLSQLLNDFNLGHANMHITAGPPEKSIPHVANELKADVVIMGCVGRTGVKGFLLGNTAEKALHQLRTDILIVETQ